MNVIVFHGRVIPERVNFNHPIVGIMFGKIKIEFVVNYSEIITKCTSETEIVDIPTLKNDVQAILQNFVDGYGFGIACGYDVEIDSSYRPSTNEVSYFSVQNLILTDELNKKIEMNTLLSDYKPAYDFLGGMAVLNICLQNPPFRVALSDFRESMRKPEFTAFYCYRAIESLRYLFDGDEATQWKKLSDTIKVPASKIADIKKHAGDQRHGNVLPQTWEQRKEHMYISWEIIRRAILYKSNIKGLDSLTIFE